MSTQRKLLNLCSAHGLFYCVKIKRKTCNLRDIEQKYTGTNMNVQPTPFKSPAQTNSRYRNQSPVTQVANSVQISCTKTVFFRKNRKFEVQESEQKGSSYILLCSRVWVGKRRESIIVRRLPGRARSSLS
jgi:hypothetical protein